MLISFPTNTVILITAVMIVVALLIWLMLSHVLDRLPLSSNNKRNWRWGAALVLGIWLIVRLELSINPPDGKVLGTPIIIAFIVFGFVVGTLPLLLSATFRQIIRATPLTWIIGIHAIRVAGGLFLALNDMKLLPSAFALPAGYGDVITGSLSPMVIYLLLTKKPYARELAIVWNVFGILDLVIALVTGTIYIPPFAAQLATTGTSLLYLNDVFFIPTYIVPLLGSLHIYALYQLLLRPVDVKEQEVDDSVHLRMVISKQDSGAP
jgi:hypothetical protein